MATAKKAAAKKAAAAPARDNAQEAGLRKAYGLATTRLREAHRSEFQGLYKAAAEELGVEYTPRLTKEERAERDLAALLEEFPHLRDRLDEDKGEPEDDEESEGDGAEVRQFDTAR